ncbi:MAG TPA: serine hydrolase, partial [Desulfuromonadaceae bacterium]
MTETSVHTGPKPRRKAIWLSIMLGAAVLGLATLAFVLFGMPGMLVKHKPALVCEGSTGMMTGQKALARILHKMNEDAQRLLDEEEIRDIALYYRDLKSGAWVAINKDKKFYTASLIKVPLMMECLEAVQSHPELSKKYLPFTGGNDWSSRQNIKPKKSLEPGKAYSLDDLLFRMIAYSDNNAMQVLLEEFPSDNLYHFLADHNADFDDDDNDIKMSLGTYSRFFEDLYDKSYLNTAMSKKALSYLAAEDFPQGMHAAVPPNVAVESKFGERIVKDTKGTVVNTQLHEVGIVLGDDHPFLLGIMTSGDNLTVLEKVIREISHDVYEEAEHTANSTKNQT